MQFVLQVGQVGDIDTGLEGTCIFFEVRKERGRQHEKSIKLGEFRLADKTEEFNKLAH